MGVPPMKHGQDARATQPGVGLVRLRDRYLDDRLPVASLKWPFRPRDVGVATQGCASLALG